MSLLNQGFVPSIIDALKLELKNQKNLFKIISDNENSEEFVNFHFIGFFEGREVIFDAALYTLRLHHASEVYDLAEQEAFKKFPNFKTIDYQEDEKGNLKPLTSEEEEIGWFITEIIMEIEEDESVKVQEFVDLDTHHDFGVGLDVALNIESIDASVINKFIREFNDDSLKLDDTLYSFISEDADDFDEDE